MSTAETGSVIRLLKLSLRIAAIAALQLMENPAMSQPKCDIMRMAEEYIAKQFPFFDSAGLKPVVSDLGNLWEFTYELPRGMLGGAPIISIDKRTCTIVRAQLSQ